MKRYLAAAAACFAVSAYADFVASNGSDSVRVQDAPCPEAILAKVPPEARKQFRAASAHVGGKDFRACWAQLPDGSVLIQYEDGDQGLIPNSAFRPAP